MGFLKKIGSALGLSSSGGGGTRDAFEQFEKYIGAIQPDIEGRMREIQLEGRNQFQGFGLGGSFRVARNAMNEQAARLRGLEGSADAIPGLLTDVAREGTSTAVATAATAARAAGGSRGGLAFGGGAGRIAGRAAAETSSARTGALLQALLGGEQFKTQFDLSLAGLQEQNLAQNIRLAEAEEGLDLSLVQHRAGLEERRRDRMDRFRLLDIEGQFGLAQAALGGGLQGQARIGDRKQSFFQSLKLL